MNNQRTHATLLKNPLFSGEKFNKKTCRVDRVANHVTLSRQLNALVPWVSNVSSSYGGVHGCVSNNPQTWNCAIFILRIQYSNLESSCFQYTFFCEFSFKFQRCHSCGTEVLLCSPVPKEQEEAPGGKKGKKGKGKGKEDKKPTTPQWLKDRDSNSMKMTKN